MTTATLQQEFEITVWVGNLGKYNEGELVGDWFTLPHDVSEIMERIGVAPNTEYEESEIFDYEEHPFVKIGRSSSIESLNDIADELLQLNEEQLKVLATLVDYGALDGSSKGISSSIDAVRSGDVYIIHEASTLADIARQQALDSGIIEEEHPLFNYIDFDEYADELDTSSTYIQMYGEDNKWVQFLH